MEITNLIKRNALPQNIKMEAGKITDAKVKCTGCGKWISITDDLDQVSYAKTKRKTIHFFHIACLQNIWNMALPDESRDDAAQSAPVKRRRKS